MKVKTWKVALLSVSLLFLSGQATLPLKPPVKVYNAMIPMIDDHLKAVSASSEASFDSKKGIKVYIQTKPKTAESLGWLRERHIAKFYRDILADTYFQNARVPKPKPSPYVSQFQMACDGAWSRFDPRTDINALCREDTRIIGSPFALPPQRYPLKIQFEFADNELVGIILMTDNPAILEAARKYLIRRAPAK